MADGTPETEGIIIHVLVGSEIGAFLDDIILAGIRQQTADVGTATDLERKVDYDPHEPHRDDYERREPGKEGIGSDERQPLRPRSDDTKHFAHEDTEVQCAHDNSKGHERLEAAVVGDADAAEVANLRGMCVSRCYKGALGRRTAEVRAHKALSDAQNMTMGLRFLRVASAYAGGAPAGGGGRDVQRFHVLFMLSD